MLGGGDISRWQIGGRGDKNQGKYERKKERGKILNKMDNKGLKCMHNRKNYTKKGTWRAKKKRHAAR
jgi:hypothetical protein